MIKKYAAYNFWANSLITNSVLQLENEKTNKELVSSFTTIRKTIYHIWDAETIWLERLTQSAISKWPPSQRFTDLTSLNMLVQSSSDLLTFVESKNEVFFTECTIYKNSKGVDYKTRNEDILQHVFNHSTFHRGQLVTMLRQVGVDNIPQTDYIAYVRL